jgi:cellulose synthase (UDP-forming)
MINNFYFSKFEDRVPPNPLKNSIFREIIWQFLAVMCLVFGAWYIFWRWNHSINYSSLWFSIPLLLAETISYFGLILFTINLWKVEDYEQKAPPEFINECIDNNDGLNTIISVDVFIATYNEDTELVRLSIIDAKKIKYPYKINLQIYVLDDGRRPEMKQVADEELVNYISRDNNIGFKAGNMRNAMEKTSGDFIVICDADTRPFPTILENTLGYFKDPNVAWIQTPQWFYDLPEGKYLHEFLLKKLGLIGKYIGKSVEYILGPIKIGSDPFVNEPKMFYDIILRRRNWANAAFCCGAGSIHRREAVMEAALKAYSESIEKIVQKETKEIYIPDIKTDLSEAMTKELSLETEFTPYKFHVSEDIYTSIILHSDSDRKWKSVLHPKIESKMLSPQDLYSWAVQRFKYAGGTIDIAFHDNPVLREGLSSSQKLMYACTMWSYFGCIPNVIFLFAPIIFFFTGVSPVSAYTDDFFIHIIPFLLLNEISVMIGTWGINTYSSKASYLSFFPINIRALLTVIRGEKIKFPVTPKNRQEGNFFHLVIPQFMVIVLTIIGIIFSLIKYELGYENNLSAIFTNSLWGINNIINMSGIVMSAFWKPED